MPFKIESDAKTGCFGDDGEVAGFFVAFFTVVVDVFDVLVEAEIEFPLMRHLVLTGADASTNVKFAHGGLVGCKIDEGVEFEVIVGSGTFPLLQMVEVVAPERVTSQTIEQAVYPSQRNTIARAHIPDNVTSIDYGAFFGCDSLTGINIGNCVTSLGSDLFWNCTALSTLTIPSSVESIGENAFYNCSSLTDVTFNGKTLEQVRAMNQYPWGISDTSIIHVQG